MGLVNEVITFMVNNGNGNENGQKISRGLIGKSILKRVANFFLHFFVAVLYH